LASWVGVHLTTCIFRLEKTLNEAEARGRVKGLDEAANITHEYRYERVCGDECLTRTVVSDIWHDIRAIIPLGTTLEKEK